MTRLIDMRQNKKILLAMISLIILSVLIVLATARISEIDIKKDTPPVENIPYDASITAVEQNTYTDIWMKTSTVSVLTSSSIWADVPGIATTTIKLKYPSDLVMTFSGETRVILTSMNDDNRLDLRVLVDGNVASPGWVVFTTSGMYNSHSFSFARWNVPVGTHNVRVQWRCTGCADGGDARFDYRSLTIMANGAGHPI